MCNTVVVKVKVSAYDVYIGRAGKGEDGYFGNPHPVGWCSICGVYHDRKNAVAAFKRTFWVRVNEDVEYRERVRALAGKRLGCFCKPLACHGDVIVAWLDAGCPLRK